MQPGVPLYRSYNQTFTAVGWSCGSWHRSPNSLPLRRGPVRQCLQKDSYQKGSQKKYHFWGLVHQRGDEQSVALECVFWQQCGSNSSMKFIQNHRNSSTLFTWFLFLRFVSQWFWQCSTLGTFWSVQGNESKEQWRFAAKIPSWSGLCDTQQNQTKPSTIQIKKLYNQYMCNLIGYNLHKTFLIQLMIIEQKHI